MLLPGDGEASAALLGAPNAGGSEPFLGNAHSTHNNGGHLLGPAAGRPRHGAGTQPAHTSRASRVLPPCIVETTVLGQLLDACRSVLEPHELDQPLTSASVAAALVQVAGEDASVAIDAVVAKLHVETLPAVTTFREALTFDSKGFPILPLPEKATLLVLSEQGTVSRAQVAEALGCAADSELVAALFAFGVDTIPGIVLKDLVEGMSSPPNKLRFVDDFAEEAIRAQRSMATFFVYTAFFLLTLYFVSNINVWEIFNMTMAAYNPTTDAWSNFCPNGVTQPCNMILKTLFDVHTEQDALQYLRRELVLQLWGWMNTEASAAVVPFAGAWLVGSLLVRVTPGPGANTSSIVASCADLNLSVPLKEVKIPQEFGCDVYGYTSVPFSATQDQALAILGAMEISIPDDVDAVVALQYGMIRPSDKLLTWVSIQMTTPRVGNYIPRSWVRSIDMDVHEKVLPLLIFQALLLIFNAFTTAYYAKFSRSYVSPDNLLDIFQIVLISIAYRSLTTLPTVDDMTQSDYVPLHFDALATQFDWGMALLGFWLLFFLSLVGRYFRNIEGTQIVFALMKVALPEIVGLLVVFGVVYVAFVMVACALFGSIEPTFSCFAMANANLVTYFFGNTDYDTLAAKFPLLGGAFYYLYTLFVHFFALNLLVAVITAPLKDVRDEASLHLRLMELVSRRLHLFGGQMGTRRWQFYRSTLPLVNLVVDSIPFSPYSHYWIRVYVAARDLSDSASGGHNIRKKLQGASLLLELNNIMVEKPYETLMMNTAIVHGLVPHLPSLALMRLLIAGESRFDRLRDARLTRALIAYDRLSTRMRRLLDLVKDQSDDRDEVARDAANHGSELTESKRMAKVRRINGRFLFPVQLLSILFVYAAFTTFVTTSSQPEAYLRTNIEYGLAQAPFTTECFDPNCTSAFTYEKRFTDSSHINDFYQYLSMGFQPQLFPTSAELAATNNTISSNNGNSSTNVAQQRHRVAWDHYIRRVGPVKVRQLRGIPIECQFRPEVKPGDPIDPARISAMTSLGCYSTYQFDSTPMPRPNGSALPPSAYEFREGCAELTDFIQGYRQIYGCRGYTTDVASVNQLNELMNWIDNATRFICITVTFELSGFSMQYNMYVELGDFGGTGYVWTLATPLQQSTIGSANVAGYALVALKLFTFLGSCAKYFYYAFVMRKLKKADMIKPFFPTLDVIYLIIIVVVNVTNLIDIQRTAYLTAVTAVYVTAHFMHSVLFPFAQLFSEYATTLIGVIKLTGKALLLVLPFFVTSFIAFMFSGFILFGRNALIFATMRQSAATTARGFLGDWSLGPLWDVDPVSGMAFTALFVFVVLIVLSNLILSLITGAADEAKKETQTIGHIKAVAEFAHQGTYDGPLMETFLSWMSFRRFRILLDRLPWVSHRARVLIACAECRRLALPAECLLPFLGPNRIREALLTLDFDRMPTWLQCSTVAFVIRCAVAFKKAFPLQDAEDEEKESLALRKAAELAALGNLLGTEGPRRRGPQPAGAALSVAVAETEPPTCALMSGHGFSWTADADTQQMAFVASNHDSPSCKEIELITALLHSPMQQPGGGDDEARGVRPSPREHHAMGECRRREADGNNADATLSEDVWALLAGHGILLGTAATVGGGGGDEEEEEDEPAAGTAMDVLRHMLL